MPAKDIENLLARTCKPPIAATQLLREIRQVWLGVLVFHTGRGRKTVRGNSEAINRIMHVTTIAGPHGRSNR